MDGQNQSVVPNVEPRRRDWDFASFAVIAVAVCVLPLFFIPSVSFPFQMGKVYVAVGATVLALILWIVSRLRDGSVSIGIHPIMWSSAIVVGSLLFSTLLSSDFSSSLLGVGSEIATFGFLATMFVLLFITSTLAQTKDRIFYLYLSLFCSFFLVSLYHIVRLIGGVDLLSFGVFTSAISNTVGKWNDLGILFGLGAVLSLVTLELASIKTGLRYALYMVLVFSLLFLTLVNFVSVWVAVMLFSLLLLVYLTISRRGQLGPYKLPFVPITVFIITLLFVVPIGRDQNGQMRYLASKVSDTMASTFNILHLEVRPTWGATFNVGKRALLTDPVFGAGPNHFVDRWVLDKPTEVNATAFWNADFTYGIGLIPTLFVTTGILGTFSWLLFLGVFIFSGFRAVFSIRPDTDAFRRYLTVSSYFSALFLWFFCFIYIPSVVPVVLAFVFTGIFVGSLIEEGLVQTRQFVFVQNPRAGFVSVLVLVFLLVLSLVTGYVYTQRIRSVIAFQKGVFAFNVEGNPKKAEELFKKAVRASEVDAYYRFLSELTLVKINNTLSQNASATNVQKAQQDLLQLFGEAKLYAEQARDITPTSYQNWLALGRVYEALVPLKVEGAYAEAIKAYDEAQKRNPTNPEILLTKARLEVANGQNKKARELIGQALKLKPNYTEGVFYLSQIEVAEGKIKEAISSVEASIFLSPSEPVLYFQLGLLKYNINDFKGAIDAFEQAIALNQNYANARYFLGLAYDRVGKIKEAIGQFEAIKLTNPDNQEVEDILVNLKAGKAPFAGGRIPRELPVSEESRVGL